MIGLYECDRWNEQKKQLITDNKYSRSSQRTSEPYIYVNSREIFMLCLFLIKQYHSLSFYCLIDLVLNKLIYIRNYSDKPPLMQKSFLTLYVTKKSKEGLICSLKFNYAGLPDHTFKKVLYFFLV